MRVCRRVCRVGSERIPPPRDGGMRFVLPPCGAPDSLRRGAALRRGQLSAAVQLSAVVQRSAAVQRSIDGLPPKAHGDHAVLPAIPAPGRHAEGDAERWQRATHQRCRADHAAGADLRAVHQHRVGADPHVVADADTAAAGLEALVADRPVRIGECVVGRREGAVGRDQHVAADADAVAGVEHAARVDDAAAADHHVAVAARRLDLDEGVDRHVVLDDDAAAAPRILDVGEAGDAGGRGDAQHASASTLPTGILADASLRAQRSHLPRVTCVPVRRTVREIASSRAQR